MRLRRLVVPISGIVFAGAVVVGSAFAQTLSLADRIAAATTRMSLNRGDPRPFHLKLDVTIFDEKGKNPSEGAIEVWRSGADQRTVYTFGDSTRTSVKHEGGLYGASSGPSLPYEADEVLQQVLGPGPDDAEISEGKLEMRKQKFGKTSLNCIMLSQPHTLSDVIPFGLYPTYCLDADDVIRVASSFGNDGVVFNRVGKFLDRMVPVQLTISNGEITVATAKVSLLTTYVPKPGEFLPAAGMGNTSGMTDLTGLAMKGSRVSFVEPVYPDGAKVRHESGTVHLSAIIGRDGKVHSLRPIDSSDADFLVAAITAVRKWTYRPYLLNGEPVEVHTTITVNFQIN